MDENGNIVPDYNPDNNSDPQNGSGGAPTESTLSDGTLSDNTLTDSGTLTDATTGTSTAGETTTTVEQEPTEDITTELVKLNPYRYAGYYWDRKTQYYYLQARYYDPRNGRFLSADTYRGEIDSPLSLHLYAYAFNNPVNYVDPSGNCPFCIPLLIWVFEVALDVAVTYVALDAAYETTREIDTISKLSPDDRLNYMMENPGSVIPAGGIIFKVSKVRLTHASLGEFTSTGRLIGGGHGQENIDYLISHDIEFNIEKEFSNGVRVGNVPSHKNASKRTGIGQAWFPKNWTREDIRKAGIYIANLDENKNIGDGVWMFGNYNGVRIGVIKNKGEIGTITPDNSFQP